ncbi:site-specific integrase [Parafrankia sp. EUN1f]|uniref:tyrosine-type recombinase/integrase n=1 Tax=Parafrankia sp. EUN1f TaxID=102897 RepID=UPI0001C43DD1|nr:site-specific integrase [Parafrankia sp. EUN1f]EFC85964.1 integrase family protein [Parafrankia sp. EUN1f]
MAAGDRSGKGRRGNNEGSIYRYRNGWAGQVSLPDGRRPTFYGPTREPVREKMTAALRAAQDGTPVVTTQITVGEYLDQWVTVVLPARVVAGTLAESTMESYALLVRLHIVPVLGRHKLRDLSTAHVRKWMTAKLTEPSAAGVAARKAREEARAAKERQKAEEAAERAEDGQPKRPRRTSASKLASAPAAADPKPIKPLSARSVRYLHAILRTALADAMREELVSRNVAELVQPPKSVKGAARSLSDEEARKAVAVALVDRNAALWLVILALGLRKGEALALRWDVVDLDAGTVAIVRKQRRRRSHIDPETGVQRWELVEDDELKTAGSRARLALPTMVVTVLREHRRRQEKARAEACEWADPGLVFTSATGNRIDPRNVNRWWDKVCERAEIPHTRVHDLRHTAASLLFSAGVDLNEIRALLRHTRLATTADIYVDILDEVRRSTARSMDDILTRLHRPSTTDSDENGESDQAVKT